MTVREYDTTRNCGRKSPLTRSGMEIFGADLLRAPIDFFVFFIFLALARAADEKGEWPSRRQDLKTPS